MHDFKKLQIWQGSMKLVTEVYTLTHYFPNDLRFGLTNQIQRSAVSVPSNISEGAGRKGNKEFSQFLSTSVGSLCELETQLIIANN